MYVKKLSGLKPDRVFHYFEEISAIPRGSGNMANISAYCMDFAKQHGLHAVQDDAHNVVIYKPAGIGKENAAPVILQGHLDMVCQKTESSTINFETDGIELVVDGDYIRANGTTLGADNGIAAAMILAILEDTEAAYPAIEALFTTDEEIGMVGAMHVDGASLTGRKLINLDAEEPELLTVSCAGGSDFIMEIPFSKEPVQGTKVTITVKGLTGGHSGVEIHKGRVNADMLMGRILHSAPQNFRLISVNGGSKANAIPVLCQAEVAVADAKAFSADVLACLASVHQEIADREPAFLYDVTVGEDGAYDAMDQQAQDKLIYTLFAAPNGVMEMSAVIENLVETSLNLGVLKTDYNKIILHFALRSNKQSALCFLEEKLTAIAEYADISVKTFGHYPPWEFQEDSSLQKLYKEVYLEKMGKEPQVAAIHAGLECGVLSAKIPGLDCIAIGPETLDVHTVNERVSIPSVGEIYEIVQNLLKKCD